MKHVCGRPFIHFYQCLQKSFTKSITKLTKINANLDKLFPTVCCSEKRFRISVKFPFHFQPKTRMLLSACFRTLTRIKSACTRCNTIIPIVRICCPSSSYLFSSSSASCFQCNLFENDGQFWLSYCVDFLYAISYCDFFYSFKRTTIFYTRSKGIHLMRLRMCNYFTVVASFYLRLSVERFWFLYFSLTHIWTANDDSEQRIIQKYF